MATLSIDNLSKVFDDGDEKITAIDSLDLDVQSGEFIVFVGPSGCGKSTTLRCIAGLEQVTSGAIYLAEEEITDQKPMNRDIAMVFQNYALYPHKSARENMAFGLRMSTDFSKSEIKNRINNASEMMGIDGLLNKKPAELSGGQQQRVALGRAIVREPEVFLMDEPLSNLDAKLRTQMRTELQELQQKLDTTTIYVTHDQTEAMTMGDRIVVLNNGELQQVGTPLECYHTPANRFVAGFIGSPGMNFIPVEIDYENTLHHDSFDFQLSESTTGEMKDLSGSEDLILGIRPEDIHLADGASMNKEITVNADTVEPLGDVTHVHFSLNGTKHSATISSSVEVGVGQELCLVFPENKIHLFDQRTGEALKTAGMSTSATGQPEPKSS